MLTRLHRRCCALLILQVCNKSTFSLCNFFLISSLHTFDGTYVWVWKFPLLWNGLHMSLVNLHDKFIEASVLPMNQCYFVHFLYLLQGVLQRKMELQQRTSLKPCYKTRIDNWSLLLLMVSVLPQQNSSEHLLYVSWETSILTLSLKTLTALESPLDCKENKPMHS